MTRILIADDHSVVRAGIRQILSEGIMHAEITEVADVPALIHQIMATTFDLLICDISMPGKTGLEAIPQIKEIQPNLPIIMISIHPEEHYGARALKAGASGYVSKDLAPEDLIDVVKTVLSGKKYISPVVAEKLLSISKKGTEHPLHSYLSDREFAVLKLLATGKSISEISDAMNIGLTTVSTYRSRILNKLDMKTNAELTIYCREEKLI